MIIDNWTFSLPGYEHYWQTSTTPSTSQIQPKTGSQSVGSGMGVLMPPSLQMIVMPRRVCEDNAIQDGGSTVTLYQTKQKTF